jgi:uncharacterized membrane protein
MSSFFRRLQHVGMHRPRLLGACVWGLVVWLLLPDSWTAATRLLVAWNAAVWPYLASMAWLMLRCAPALVAIMSTAAVLSVVAIVAELAASHGAGRSLLFAFAFPVVTVTGSWFLLGTVYTFHYAHMFYEAASDQRPLRFPEEAELPSYRDFLYFSFTIAVAAQTSDVTVLTTPMRSAVLAQSVLSFFFNVAILGLSINIAAGVVGGH